jgi:hypothetical protein
MQLPPDSRKARAGVPGLDWAVHSNSDWRALNSPLSPTRQAPLFTARPRGTRWCVTAISSADETMNLGDFPSRGTALYAAHIMAQACGGRAVA